MNFQRKELFLLGLSTCFIFACGGGNPQSKAKVDAPTDLARLVPAKSTLYIQFSSLDAVNELSALLVRELGDGVDPGAQLRGTLEEAMDREWLDSAQPIGFAGDPALLMSGGNYLQSLIVPARNVDKLRASLRGTEGMAEAVAKGSYIGVPQTASYELGADSHSISKSMLDGDISLRLDLQTLLEALRPTIDAGLDAIPALLSNPAFAELDESADGVSGVEKVFAAYITALRSFMDAAEQLDLSLDVEGDELSLNIEFKALENSPMSDLGVNSKGNLRKMAGYLDLDSVMAQVMGVDAIALLDFSGSFFAQVLQGYPRLIQSLFDATSADFNELIGLLQGSMANDLYLDSNGMQGTYFLETHDADALIAKLDLIFANRALTNVGIAGHKVEQLEIKGLQVTRHRFEFNWDLLSELLAQTAQMEEDEFKATIQGIYGESGLQISIAASDGIVVLVGGGDDAFHESALGRFASGPAKLSNELERAVAAVESSPMAFVSHLDVPQYLHGLNSTNPMLESLATDLNVDALAEHSASIWMHGSIDGQIWSGHMHTDLPQLAVALKSMGN